MKPTLRLTWRLAPYMFLSLLVLFLVVLMPVALLKVGLHTVSFFTLLWTVYLVTIFSMIIRDLGGTELAKELTERSGKPIKVFRPGKRNYRFMKRLGWYYEDRYAVFVNPRMDRFSSVKYLYLLDPSSTELSDQLLEVAATNWKAFEEISSKVSSGKYRASSDLRKYESAVAVSESIADIMK